MQNGKDKFKSPWAKLFEKNTTTDKTQKKTLQPVLSKNETLINSKPLQEKLKGKTINDKDKKVTEMLEITIISKETEINGSIVSRGNVFINGKVKGNITSDANIKVTGKVEGDIKGKSVEIFNGKILGNITSKTTVAISENSQVEGDIDCDTLSLNGSVNGNAQVVSSAALGKEAVIYGNLTTQRLSITEGAVVNGIIKASKDNENNQAKLA